MLLQVLQSVLNNIQGLKNIFLVEHSEHSVCMGRKSTEESGGLLEMSISKF